MRYRIIVICMLLAILLLNGCVSTYPKKKEEEKTIPMDMLMWYDIDISKSTNTRPDRGWYYLYRNHPDVVDVNGIYRTTTPLLGLYDQKKPETARQHLYWMAALGCNGVVCDWTNCNRYSEGSEGMQRYSDGVLNCTEVLLNEAVSLKDSFSVPDITVALRLFGSDFESLQKELDDIYALYEKYSEKWYKLSDGSDDADKPFIMIFADNSLNAAWSEQGSVPFHDEKWNIRWTNGNIASTPDGSGNYKTALSCYWSFWDCVRKESGDYEARYACGADGSVEEMCVWASVHMGGTNWDEMLCEIDGKTTFERSFVPVCSLRPKAVLVCRFNYPVAWLAEPQEGVSLLGSTHIEPNVDIGFRVFDDVRENIYMANGLPVSSPAIPELIGSADNTITISVADYPQEYIISVNEDLTGAEWEYFNYSKQIFIPDENQSDILYLKIRNTFGESDTAVIKWDSSLKEWRVYGEVCSPEK